MSLFVSFEIIGTIAFAISGAVVAISKKMDIFGVAILGMTTAVGGGMLRDMLCGQIPFVLRKRIYVFAALAGALLYLFLRDWNEVAATGIVIGAVVLVRLLASHFRWSLPRVHRPEDDAAPELPSQAEKEAKN